MTDETGIYAAARHDWFAHLSLNEELIRKECARRFQVGEKRLCRPGSRQARIIELLTEAPRTLDELAELLECPRHRVAHTIGELTGKGFKFVSAGAGKIAIGI